MKGQQKFSIVNVNNNLTIGFESYNGKTVMIPIKQAYLISLPSNKNWQMVNIPFSEFNFEKEGFDITRFKQLIIELNNK